MLVLLNLLDESTLMYVKFLQPLAIDDIPMSPTEHPNRLMHCNEEHRLSLISAA